MIEALLERLNVVISAFEAYEQPIVPDEAISVVRDLIAALRQVHVPHDQELWADSNAVYAHMVDIEYAREQADTARLLLAAYAPHAQSMARRYLERRREIIYQLRELVKAATKAVPSGIEQLKRVRPAYLRVVDGSDQHGHEEQERKCSHDENSGV
jgi:hypothetical protein